MKVYHCDHCDSLVFFENILCVNCGHTLAFVKERDGIAALEARGDGTYLAIGSENGGRIYKLCDNYATHQICNRAIVTSNANTLCGACRLTRMIPDLSVPGHREKWYKLEVAKRRLLYTLYHLGLPTISKIDDPEKGLIFDFLADPTDPSAPRVLTGHANGVITVNLDEADDAVREKRRTDMHEPYRTLLGHFRHEVGHYYWDVLIAPNSERLEAFRKIFGDDRQDYGEALKTHYAQGAPPNWQDSFVSEYATTHAWEDWAETWAHYLHIVDTLETASDSGISIRPSRHDEPTVKEVPNPVQEDDVPFRKMMAAWGPLTYVLNSLNRGLGVSDAYPFVISPPVVAKLKFVHDTIAKTCVKC